MADLKKLVDAARSALMAGDSAGALSHLTIAAKKSQRDPTLMEPEIVSELTRLARIARAAADGIADARALIVQAGGNARNLKTYDGKGIAKPVKNKQATIGRF
ncbi:MAG: hypothetical protein DI616_14110 [Paracoccus denitrificans]|uniref:Uncharacterized protein n=1 Tax=Paracoccus denitrificans TaxID=266 RepID=A0A533I6S9_PARDE|nr:MAG: hypothetical protein DI616_14110 [Paracoccus denitrificans]